MNTQPTPEPQKTGQFDGARRSDSLERVIASHCAHIQKPYTMDEICAHVESDDYSPELMLQHLLLWVQSNESNSSKATP